jgi:hypothetical protein
MNQIIRCFLFALSIVFLLNACSDTRFSKESNVLEHFYPTTKPGVRWWWFATEIKKPDVKHQLDWAAEQNFGAVEIAWVYPLYRYQRMYSIKHNRSYPIDTSAQKWLSPEWSEIVTYTKRYADSIGMACDFTFGSAWPVAASNLDKKYGTQVYGDSTFQQTLTFAWSWPDTQLVINHLDPKAFEIFAEPIGEALGDALKGSKSALFTDSWEIKLNDQFKIWTPGFDRTFKEQFGYDILPFMEAGIDSFPDVRYDYMLHLDEYVTNGFYKPYAEKCKELGAWSRVQCLASPTDVMNTYGLVDIPETEAMLNNPNYSKIVSSAACLASKKVVSSETFTCLYGFPAMYLREEQTADLKMVADAMFAQGANQHFYHGMPYNPIGSDSLEFFATIYIGPNGSLTEELPAFNAYMEKVSGIMQTGKTYSDVAVYIPYEDAVMKGALPPEKRRVWVWGEYELRYEFFPEETKGFHPLWINRGFLDKAVYKNNRLIVGDANFSSLYVDANYIDLRALDKIVSFAKQGLPICLKKDPMEPGHIKSGIFDSLLTVLHDQANVTNEFSKAVLHEPFLEADQIPEYWARIDEDQNLYLFIAQNASLDLKYPVYSGQSYMDSSEYKKVKIHYLDVVVEEEIEFKPYQSVALKISPDGRFEYLDIEFVPKDPLIRPKEKQRMYF